MRENRFFKRRSSLSATTTQQTTSIPLFFHSVCRNSFEKMLYRLSLKAMNKLFPFSFGFGPSSLNLNHYFNVIMDSSNDHDHASSSAGDNDGTVIVAASSSSSSSQSSNSLRTEDNASVSEPWTRIFPEAYGIRKAIEDSPFRWCVRESSLWAVATGTVMGM